MREIILDLNKSAPFRFHVSSSFFDVPSLYMYNSSVNVLLYYELANKIAKILKGSFQPAFPISSLWVDFDTKLLETLAGQ